MRWESTEQIATYFDLIDETKADPEDLRRAITKKMAAIHPDTNGDKFADPETENLWHELQSAKGFVDKSIASAGASSDHQLIPVSQVTDLVKTITQVGMQPIETRVTSLKREARDDAKSRGVVPRIGSGVFATGCGFLFTFSSAAKDHPLIGEWLQTSTAQLMLLSGMLYSGMFFLMTWTRERRQESLVEFLSSEEGLRHTLSNLFAERTEDRENPRRFTLRELTEALRPGRHGDHFSPFLLLFGGESMSRSVADKIASLHVERLTKRGVIIEIPQKSLDRAFEVSRSTYKELLESEKD